MIFKCLSLRLYLHKHCRSHFMNRMDKNDISHFLYNQKDFNFKVQSENESSHFDLLLKQKWSKADQDNVLRYSVKSQEFKILEGKYGFLAQLNIERATMRRSPEKIISMHQPFDPNRFNFTKIASKEILIDIGDGQGNDIISVNISPILWSHSLLLPQRFKCLPQDVTFYSLQKALEILLLSKSINLRVLFNSLCANASVNHLHWHLYYLNYRMLLEWISLKKFIDSVYVIENYPAEGFCIKLSSFKNYNIQECVSCVYKVISCLQQNEFAHNIYITRAKTCIEKEEYDDIRIYIWARTPSYGIKNTEDFIVAACEVFGHLPIRTKEAYERLNEEYVSKCLHDVTSDAFLLAQKKIVEVFQNSEEKKSDSRDTAM